MARGRVEERRGFEVNLMEAPHYVYGETENEKSKMNITFSRVFVPRSRIPHVTISEECIADKMN